MLHIFATKKNFAGKRVQNFLGCAMIAILVCGMTPVREPEEVPLYPQVPEKVKNSTVSLVQSPDSVEGQNFLDLGFYGNVPCKNDKFGGNNLCYKNYRTPQKIEFNNDGLYFGIDGSIAKFTDINNADKAKRNVYQEVVRNCGGENEEDLGWRPLPTTGPSKYTDDLHPRWAGSLALGQMSTTDKTTVAYSSTYGDILSPAYRNYRAYNGSTQIFERKDFRAEADRNGSAVAATDGGAAVDVNGNYWKQNVGTGEKVEFLRQDQSTGAFMTVKGFTADADPVWAKAKVTPSFEFDAVGGLHVLAFDEETQNLWLYNLDTVGRKAVRQKQITGDLANKDVLFLPDGQPRINGLAWWNKTWWAMMQDKRNGQGKQKDAKLYKVDPRTGKSTEWFAGVTLGEGSCNITSWLGGLASAEQMPENPGAALTAKVTANTLNPKRNEIVKYTIDVQNIGWSPYEGEIEVDLSGITESPSKDPNILNKWYGLSGGAVKSGWGWKGQNLIWKGTIPPSPQDNGRDGGKVTITVDFRVDGAAPHEKTLPVTVNTAAETISDCAKGDSGRKPSCRVAPSVHAQPQLDIVKKQELLEGGIVRYKVTVLNKGSAEYSNEIADNLSDDSSATIYDSSSASAEVNGQQRGVLTREGSTLMWNKEGKASLGRGETLVISYQVSIKPEAVGK